MTATEYTVTTPATRLVEVRNNEVRTLLAHRINAMSKAIEHQRKRKVRDAADYASAALSIEGSMTALAELERVWECLFEDMPSLLTISRIVTTS